MAVVEELLVEGSVVNLVLVVGTVDVTVVVEGTVEVELATDVVDEEAAVVTLGVVMAAVVVGAAVDVSGHVADVKLEVGTVVDSEVVE